jgi:hypothetical protein
MLKNKFGILLNIKKLKPYKFELFTFLFYDHPTSIFNGIL